MRIRVGRSEEEIKAAKERWHRWFAWYPVELEFGQGGQMAWLEVVEWQMRSEGSDEYGPTYEYREKRQ